jgi:hypothetical protein
LEIEATSSEQTILGLVPTDISHNFITSEQPVGVHVEAKSLVSQPEKLTTSENLRNLTTDFLQLHEQLESDEGTRRRCSSLKGSEQTSLIGHKNDETKKTEARKNWNKLKVAMAVTSNTKTANGDIENGISPKDRDDMDATEIDVGEDVHNPDSKQSVGSRRKKQKQGKMKLAALQFKTGFRDFEEWVRFKQTNILTYVKYLLLLLVPATGIASM